METNKNVYRTDELILIINSCQSLAELEEVLRSILYLTRLGLQKVELVVAVLTDTKESELIKALKYGKNNNH